jgi:hypothetical protein
MGLFDGIGDFFGLNDENKVAFQKGTDQSPVFQIIRPFINGTGNILGGAGQGYEKASAGVGKGLENTGAAAGNVIEHGTDIVKKLSDIIGNPQYLYYGLIGVGGIMIYNVVKK